MLQPEFEQQQQQQRQPQPLIEGQGYADSSEVVTHMASEENDFTGIFSSAALWFYFFYLVINSSIDKNMNEIN